MRRFVAVFMAIVLACTFVPLVPGPVAASPSGGSGAKGASKTVRILCVGNSWTRRSLTYLCSIAKSAGVKVVIGHAYLGGSSLQEQYFSLRGGGSRFLYHGQIAKVRKSFSYHKYVNSDSYSTTPKVSLAYAIKDEPWDYVVLQNRAPESGVYAVWDKHRAKNRDALLESRNGRTVKVPFDVNDFVDLIKSKMSSRVAARVKVGLVAVWSYARGQRGDIASSMGEYIDAKCGGKTPTTRKQWNALYEKLYRDIQRTIPKVAAYMRKNCDFIVNPGRAFKYARADGELSGFGHGLQVSDTNSHPALGLPCYIAGLTYAFAILGVRWDKVCYRTRDKTPVYRRTATGHALAGYATPTARLSLLAVSCAWQAQHGSRISVLRFKAIPLYSRSSARSGRKLPALRLKSPTFGALKPKADFRVVKRSVRTVSNRLRIRYRGTGRFGGRAVGTYRLRPKRVKLESVRTNRRALLVRWRAPGARRATGVQVRCVPKSRHGRSVPKARRGRSRTVTVKSCTRGAVTVTGFKGGGRCKVQVRAYRIVKGRRYAGSWGAPRTVRVPLKRVRPHRGNAR